MADESHADILAEMRRCVESNGTKRRENVHLTVRTWLGLIERLENANRREAQKKPLGFWANGVHYTDADELRKVLDEEKVQTDPPKDLNQVFAEELGKRLLTEDYTIERSRNNGEFWSRLYHGSSLSKDDAKRLIDVEHKAHPSDWLRLVKEQRSVEREILGNRKRK